MNKKMLFVLVLMMITTAGMWAQTATPPAAGDGTIGNPYQIASLDNLAWLSQNSVEWDKHYIQTADIDASDTQNWDSGAGFSPIGSSSDYFTGSYDGQGYVIDGLFINRPSTDFQGLIGYTNGAEISNLGVTNTNVTGYGSTGGLVGFAIDSSTITNSYSTGSVTGVGTYTGGLVGYKRSSTIINSYSTGSVIGGSIHTGGLVGYHNLNSTITNSYSNGSVTGLGNNTGGLVGFNNSTITNSFWDTQTSGQSTSAGGTGKTTVEMQTMSTFTNAGWDFMGETANGTDDYWKIDGVYNSAYPYLSWQEYPIPTPPAAGDGTSGNPYQIASLDNLAWLSQNIVEWDKHYIQTADLNAADTQNWNSGAGFSPIGSNPDAFTGSYDGQGYEISGLFINRPSSAFQGLFGSTNGAVISNLGVTNTTIIGYNRTGALVGFAIDSSTISNCYSTGSVSGTLYTGGLVGHKYNNTTMTNCYSTGTVNGTSYTGGLVGENYSYSTISNCYSTGNVTGSGNYTGGLVGWNWSNSTITDSYSTGIVNGTSYTGGLVGNNKRNSIITNSYSTGGVNGTSYTGGLVGYNYNNSPITNCYSTGSVSGTTGTGGLMGYNFNSTITNSFWDTQTSGQSTSAGGTGKSTAELQTMSTYTNAGWDFMGETVNGTDDYWGINGVDNGAYPFLSWQTFVTLPNAAEQIFPTDAAADMPQQVTVNWNYTARDNPTGFYVYKGGAAFRSNFPNGIATSVVLDFGGAQTPDQLMRWNGSSWEDISGLVTFGAGTVSFVWTSATRGEEEFAVNNGDGPLPVTLSSFTASFSNGTSMLSWTTQSESNNLGWNVYRSGSEEITEGLQINNEMIEGAGTTTEQTDYTFTDQNEIVPNTSYWYWIESVDQGGSTSLHGPVRVDISDEDDDELPPELISEYGLAQNYPNPFNPSTKIAFKLSEQDIENAKLKIYNPKGQIVKTFDNLSAGNSELGSVTWDGTDDNGLAVSSGIYMYKLKTTNKEYTKKMIMMK
jgi:hypothetical protein